MDTNNQLKALEKIKPCDPPPFLLTRIKAAIADIGNAPAPLRLRLAFATAFVAVIAANIVVIAITSANQSHNLEVLIEAMQLSSLNTLYYE